MTATATAMTCFWGVFREKLAWNGFGLFFWLGRGVLALDPDRYPDTFVVFEMHTE
jgi:hypothetical protein